MEVQKSLLKVPFITGGYWCLLVARPLYRALLTLETYLLELHQVKRDLLILK